jgi:hypothetical protein
MKALKRPEPYSALAVMGYVLLGASDVPMHSAKAAPNVLGVQEVCAQTGTCVADDSNICFVNGQGFFPFHWVNGGS